MPSWVDLVYEFRTTKIKAAQEAAFREKGALVKATKKVSRKSSEAEVEEQKVVEEELY